MRARDWWLGGAAAAISAALLILWGFLDEWEADTALGVAGIYLSVAGFTVAIAEIRRARTVSAATKRAVTETLRGVATSRLATTISEMRQASREFEQAGVRDDPEAARRAIHRWTELGGDADTLIRRRFGPGHSSLPTVAGSVERALRAKGALYRQKKSTINATADCLQGMDSALTVLNPLTEDLVPFNEHTGGPYE